MRFAQKSKAKTRLDPARLKLLATFEFDAYMAAVKAHNMFMHKLSVF
jgi:hypothetical protein